jgi:IS605 OrfB family transposase
MGMRLITPFSEHLCYNRFVQRTIRFPLMPTAEQSDVLLETMQQYMDCFNAVAAWGWEHREKNGVELHKATYYPLRAAYPQLPAQLVISARSKAAEAVKSALTWKAKREREFPKKIAKALARGKPTPTFKPIRCPRSSNGAIRYDQRSYTFYGDSISLATVTGRQIVAVHLYPYARRLLQQSIEYDSADLIFRQGRFWLHLVVTLPQVEFIPNGEVIGVDFGITRPAVASNNQFFGKRSWKNTERRYFRLKRALQSKGSDSAKRHLKRLSHKVSRFRLNCDHIVSRQLVQSAVLGTTIVIENLMEIRTTTHQNGKEQRRAMHQWSFNRLRDLLIYKAEECGCAVVAVAPRHTSQRCSRCGYVHRSNRRSQSRFRCQNCGFELNADLNGSRNIALKYLASVGIADTGGLMSTSLS